MQELRVLTIIINELCNQLCLVLLLDLPQELHCPLVRRLQKSVTDRQLIGTLFYKKCRLRHYGIHRQQCIIYQDSTCIVNALPHIFNGFLRVGRSYDFILPVCDFVCS